jgi:hypothetical protein
MDAQGANVLDETKMSLHDRLCADAEAGQAAILEEDLKMGVPIVYQNEKGDLVQKNPDGSITPYDKNQWEKFHQK